MHNVITEVDTQTQPQSRPEPSTIDTPQSEIGAVPINLRRNFFAFATDMLGFMIGLSFIPASIVLVGMASRLTDDKALLGIVAMIGSVAWFLPQVLAARIVHGKRRQKPYLIVSALAGRQAYLLLVFWLLATNAEQPLLTVGVLILCIALFHVCDSLAGVAWFDILSRALSPRLRGRSIAIGNFVGLAAGIGSALIVERVLSPDGLPFPQNYALIFFCAWVCFMISFVGCVLIREIPMAAEEHSESTGAPFSVALLTLLKTDKVFQRLLLARVLTGIEAMALAFYPLFIRERLQLPESVLGIFALAAVGGGLAGLLLFGLVGERYGSRRVIHVATSLQVVGPLLAFVVAAVSILPTTAPDLAYAMFIVVIAIGGAVGQAGMLGFQVYPLDVAPERHRAMYIGVLNSAGGVVSLTPLLAGLLIDAISETTSSTTAYAVVFAIALICVVAGLVISLRLPKPARAM
jgi:MFS family permease